MLGFHAKIPNSMEHRVTKSPSALIMVAKGRFFMDNQKTGAYITFLRKERGMTQKDLAERIGVTDKAVSRWETGRGFPDVSILKPLSKALGVTVIELVNGEPSPPEAIPAKADNALLETICYFKSMARKAAGAILLLAGVCLAALPLVAAGRISLLFSVPGICLTVLGGLLLSRAAFPCFRTLSPPTARRLSLTLQLTALLLELLPCGVVMRFADGPEKVIQYTVSYFDPLPFEYGNFFPLITAILTAAGLIGLLASVLWKGRIHLQNAVFLCCVITLACSLVPLLPLFSSTFVGALISLCLLSSVVLQAAANRDGASDKMR